MRRITSLLTWLCVVTGSIGMGVAENDFFGSSVALSSDGNTAIIGADSADVGGITNQGALFDLSSTPVLSALVLPRGTYDFWFAVDYPMDGILNPEGQILYDKVTVVVQ